MIIRFYFSWWPSQTIQNPSASSKDEIIPPNLGQDKTLIQTLSAPPAEPHDSGIGKQATGESFPRFTHCLCTSSVLTAFYTCNILDKEFIILSKIFQELETQWRLKVIIARRYPRLLLLELKQIFLLFQS